MTDPSVRRTVYDISLYPLLPGMMSLGSLLAVGTPPSGARASRSRA